MQGEKGASSGHDDEGKSAMEWQKQQLAETWPKFLTGSAPRAQSRVPRRGPCEVMVLLEHMCWEGDGP